MLILDLSICKQEWYKMKKNKGVDALEPRNIIATKQKICTKILDIILFFNMYFN